MHFVIILRTNDIVRFGFILIRQNVKNIIQDWRIKMSNFKCPYCAADPLGPRERDAQGNAWHLEPNGIIHMPCYERNRATPAEIADEQENAYAYYAGRIAEEIDL